MDIFLYQNLLLARFNVSDDSTCNCDRFRTLRVLVSHTLSTVGTLYLLDSNGGTAYGRESLSNNDFLKPEAYYSMRASQVHNFSRHDSYTYEFPHKR